MKPIGFKLVDAYALEVQGVFLDLHNDYELSEVCAEFGTNSLRLSWSRSVEEHVSPGLPLAVHLIVKGAKGMRSLPPKDNWEAGGGRTLSFVGFLHVDQAQVMTGCVDYSEAGQGPDFIVGFEDESALKIFGSDGILEAELSEVGCGG